MLIHTVFSNVSGLSLGLMQLWPRPRNKFSASASLFLASVSCPAGLVNIPDIHRVHIVLTYFHQPPAAVWRSLQEPTDRKSVSDK